MSCNHEDCINLNCTMCGCEECINWQLRPDLYDYNRGQAYGECEFTGEIIAYGSKGNHLCDNWFRKTV